MLVSLQKRQRMSTLKKDLEEQYIIKKYLKEQDSELFSNDNINLLLENEAKNLEQLKIKQEYESNIQKL